MKPGLIHKGDAIMWVKFVVGSLHCSKRFFLGFQFYPLVKLLPHNTRITYLFYLLNKSPIQEKMVVFGFAECMYFAMLFATCLTISYYTHAHDV